MLRKQSAFCCCGGLPLLNSPTQRSRAPRPQSPRNRRLRHPPFQTLQCRRYASVAASEPSGGDLSWPSSSSFTPYDIFRQDRAAPYSKRRYYELVKIYHPDRPSNDHPSFKDATEEVRLRRYRLIVAAHEILSDPVKRAAYDRDGTGWHGHPDRPDTRRHSKRYGSYGSDDSDGTIYQNATWEDWERYYNRHQAKQVHLVDHRTFVTFILLLALFGGFAQASWITQYRSTFDQRIRDLNAQSARFLINRRQQTTDELKSSEARVQGFLIRRDPSGSGLKEEEEGVYKQALDPRKHNASETHLPPDLSEKQVPNGGSVGNNDTA